MGPLFCVHRRSQERGSAHALSPTEDGPNALAASREYLVRASLPAPGAPFERTAESPVREAPGA